MNSLGSMAIAFHEGVAAGVDGLYHDEQSIEDLPDVARASRVPGNGGSYP